MRHVPAMVDMSMDKEEAAELVTPAVAASDAPRYPYGLCISLCEDELEKLGLADYDMEPGDMIHFHAMATVTSVSSSQRQDGDEHCRIELQITHMSAEDEEEEDEENDEEEDKGRLSKLYF